MRKIIITITITDEETLDAYKDVHPDIIRDDFTNNPKLWVWDETKVKVIKHSPFC